MFLPKVLIILITFNVLIFSMEQPLRYFSHKFDGIIGYGIKLGSGISQRKWY